MLTCLCIYRKIYTCTYLCVYINMFVYVCVSVNLYLNCDNSPLFAPIKANYIDNYRLLTQVKPCGNDIVEKAMKQI